jgi:hypothetical protein
MEIPCENCSLSDDCKYKEVILTIISRESGLSMMLKEIPDCDEAEFIITIRRKMLRGDSPPAIMIGGIVFVAPELIIYL